MPIKTNLNIDPFFDDYDVSKKYYRVLYKPGFALQARELTQMQTILQNQIEQFGSNIYKEGTVISGCNFTELRDLKYVKVTDEIDPTNYLERTETIVNANTGGSITREYYYELVQNNDLRAIILTGSRGFISRSPDLNTFYIRYLNTGNSGEKVFTAEAALTIQEFYIETDEDGEETVYNGDGTVYDPEIGGIYDVVTTTVAQSLFDPVGDSFGINVSEGTIFQLGHFLYVDQQMIVVSKYIDSDSEITQPNDRNIGFIVDESIVNSQIDPSLLDNANGSPNEQAPGADRLMLVPRLVAVDTSVAEQDEDFFTLLRYQYGRAVYVRDVSEFNSINTQLARRTYEAHGDFVTKPFTFSIATLPWLVDEDEDANTAMTEQDSISAIVGPGVGYIKGFRVENKANRAFKIDEIEDDEVALVEDHPISLPLGDYYSVGVANGYIDNIRSMQTVNLLDSANTKIGSAIVRDISADRVYFIPASIRMSGANTFANVDGFKDGVGSTGKIYFTSPKKYVKGGWPGDSNPLRGGLLYPIGAKSIKDTTNYRIPVRSQDSKSVEANGTVIISAQAGETLNGDTLKNVFVINTSTNTKMVPSSVSVANNQLIIDGLTPSAAAKIYYNATISPTASVSKTPSDVYVKITYNMTNNDYSLGLPDCFQLLSVIDEADSNKDYTRFFALEDHQRPNWYDHSYIYLKSAYRADNKRPQTGSPTATKVFTVKVRVWRHTPVSNGTFFTVDSYADYIDELKPVRLLSSSVTNLDLKNYIDFRPMFPNTVVYAATSGAANTMANNAGPNQWTWNQELFANTHQHIVPAYDTTIFLDYNRYLSRIDVITVDDSGNFTLEKGDPALNPKPPVISGSKSIIAKIHVPGRPARTHADAVAEGDPESEVIIFPDKTVKAQTMEDVQNLTQQVERLTYYTTLSMVEQATKDLAITDSAGNNRFKNGIIVDTFSDLTFAEFGDPEYNAGQDWVEESLVPAVTTRQLDLKIANSTGVSLHSNGSFSTLTANNSAIQVVYQPYATTYRSVSSTAFSYWGALEVSPDVSQHYSYWSQPSIARPVVRNDTGAIAANATLQKFIPITGSSPISKNQGDFMYANGNVVKYGSDHTYETTLFKNIKTGQTVGSFGQIINAPNVETTINAYQHSNELALIAYGLRPNTQHYFYFDETEVTAYCRPARIVSGKYAPYGKYGVAVKTDKNGILMAEFRVPGNKFECGTKWITILDQNGSFQEAYDRATSRTKGEYTAYSWYNRVNAGFPGIVQHQADHNRTDVSKSVANRISSPTEKNSNSPMAQTFFVKRAMTGDSECLYISSVDVWFKRKSATNGITLDIRTVDNGYPTTNIVGGSRVNKTAAQVTVTAKPTSGNYTRFTFATPIRLDSEREYAIVLTAHADDPDYQIFTSRAGQKNLATNVNVVQDWGDGNLFSSTNGTAWTTYPAEDLTFRVNRYNFSASAGTITFKTGPYEFLELNDLTGQFVENEMVYCKVGAQRKLNLSVTTDSVTGTGANTTDLTVGDYIYVVNHNANTDIEPSAALLKMDARTNSTTISVTTPPPWSVTAANAWLVVAGRLQGYDLDDPFNITVEDSSARSGLLFTTSQTLEGLISGATGNIEAINDIVLSYGQLLIDKLEDSTNSITATLKATDPISNTQYNQALAFADSTYFTTKGGVWVKSHSNDLNGNSRPQVILNLGRTFKNGATGVKTTSTPILNSKTALLNAYTYQIANDNTSAFITKPVSLQNGFDAEDFRLWISAYRPVGTDIKVFIRCRNADDGLDLRSNPWIELEMAEGASYFASVANRNDFREFVYNVPDSAKDGDILTYTNTSGVFKGFREFALKIECRANRVNVVPRLLDIRGVAFE